MRVDQRTNSSAELEQMKRFSLSIVAEALGFEKNSVKSTKATCVMKNEDTGDKIVVSCRPNGHQTFFCIGGDTSVAGSFVDLLQLVHGRSFGLGQCRQFMRRLMGTCSFPKRPQQNPVVPIAVPDAFEVRRRFESTASRLINGRNAYLNQARRLPPQFLAIEHFSKSVFEDRHGNAVFPHRDQTGEISGYSMRGKRKLFSKGGIKSLWFADVPQGREGRKTLCVGEAAISVLSYAFLNYDANTCYMSTSGSLSKRQVDLLHSAFEKLQLGGNLVIAADADTAGRAFAKRLSELWTGVNRSSENCIVCTPSVEDRDWNDELVFQSQNVAQFEL